MIVAVLGALDVATRLLSPAPLSMLNMWFFPLHVDATWEKVILAVYPLFQILSAPLIIACGILIMLRTTSARPVMLFVLLFSAASHVALRLGGQAESNYRAQMVGACPFYVQVFDLWLLSSVVIPAALVVWHTVIKARQSAWERSPTPGEPSRPPRPWQPLVSCVSIALVCDILISEYHRIASFFAWCFLSTHNGLSDIMDFLRALSAIIVVALLVCLAATVWLRRSNGLFILALLAAASRMCLPLLAWHYRSIPALREAIRRMVDEASIAIVITVLLCCAVVVEAIANSDGHVICRQCGYIVGAVPGSRCPECGTPRPQNGSPAAPESKR